MGKGLAWLLVIMGIFGLVTAYPFSTLHEAFDLGEFFIRIGFAGIVLVMGLEEL